MRVCINAEYTVLLRNNLTVRSRSICVRNASGTRSERVPNAFQMRSEHAFLRKLENAFPSLVKNRVLASENPDTE